MPNYLDFLLVLDDHIRDRPDGCVRGGYEMHEIAREAGLVEPSNEAAANWTGLLVELEYVTHGPLSMGDRRPVIPGRAWDSTQVQRFTDYRLTAKGREEADRLRRQAREQHTDAVLGHSFPHLIQPWMSDVQQRAIAEPLGTLRAALDAGRYGEVIGSAKNLVEASCKIVLAGVGQSAEPNQSLPTMFKLACDARKGTTSAGDELGRSLTATVQRLAELRNIAGAGHGHASVPDRSPRDAHLAASAASSIAAFLLTPEP